jgi:ribonuclease-3
MEYTDFAAFEKKTGYEFRNSRLLKTALTHSSYASEHGKSYMSNNERLEFIGDAFLDAIVGMKLYDIMSDVHEGELSKTRANVVCERSLAEIARDIGLGEWLMLGRGEDASGGRNKDSILADALEAVIGAVIIDGGYDAGRRLVLGLFADHIRLAVRGELYSDYKTMLQEKLQKKYHTVSIEYEIVGESGPDHDKTFTVEVSVRGRVLGRGSGRNKKEAEQAAAKDVIVKGEI